MTRSSTRASKSALVMPRDPAAPPGGLVSPMWLDFMSLQTLLAPTPAGSPSTSLPYLQGPSMLHTWRTRQVFSRVALAVAEEAVDAGVGDHLGDEHVDHGV